MFASTALAARIERAEARLCAEGAAAAIRSGSADGFARPIGSGVAVFAREGSPLVKVAGLGFAGGDVDEATLAAIEAEYARRKAPVRVELSVLADPAIAPLLSRRGYVLSGFENVLGRPLSASVPAGAPGSTARIAVVEATPADDACWLAAMIDGFAHPDSQGVPSDESFPREALEAAMADMAGVSGHARYLARLDGELAGAASLVRLDGVAILCGAATLPAKRRRGVQTALLSARLALAAREGCDVAVVTTQPGSKSQQNAQRQGFALLYTRAVLVREP